MAALKVSEGACKKPSETMRKKPEKKMVPNLALEGLSFYVGRIGNILLGWLFLITLLMGRFWLMIAEVIIYFVINVISSIIRSNDNEEKN